MWRAKWTGAYPNLCNGIWRLWHNEEEIPTDKIAFNHNDGEFYYRGVPADTYGEYASLDFYGDAWEELWGHYTKGLKCDEWCNAYSEWLSMLAPRHEWSDIYAAFNAEDWRPGSCGGCI